MQIPYTLIDLILTKSKVSFFIFANYFEHPSDLIHLVAFHFAQCFGSALTISVMIEIIILHCLRKSLTASFECCKMHLKNMETSPIIKLISVHTIQRINEAYVQRLPFAFISSSFWFFISLLFSQIVYFSRSLFGCWRVLIGCDSPVKTILYKRMKAQRNKECMVVHETLEQVHWFASSLQKWR